MSGALRHHLIPILSLAGVILDALGGLYLAYDLLGGKRGPLRIEEIIANVISDQRIELTIHWKGGKHSILYVRKSRTGEHSRTTQREVVEVVRELARTLPDAQIARVLNRLGYRTGAGNTWIQSRVDALRNNNRIAAFNRERDGDRVVTID